MINLGDKNWGVKDSGLLAYKQVGSKYFNKDFDFTRASNGTYVDKDGVLQTAELYNLVSYSQDFSQGILSNCTVESGYIAPNGTLNAYKLIEDSTNSIKLFRAENANNSTPNTSYASSIFVKSAERTKVRVYGYHLANQYFYVDYDLSDNTYLGSGNSNAQVDGYSIEDVGNDWKRITIIGQKNATYSWDVGVSTLDDSGNVTYQGDGVSGVYIYGAQVVEGTEPLDYQYTNGRVGIPRIDFSDGVGALLLEPQRSNVLLKSNQFNIWGSGAGYAITPNQQGVYGSDNAFLIDKTISTNSYLIGSASTSGTHTFSVYAKAGTAPAIMLYTTGGYMRFNLETGANIGGGGGYIGQSIELIGDGWYRCSVTGSGTITTALIKPIASNGTDTIGSVYIQHAQIESGSYPTSIIETTTSTVTRIADVANNCGSEQDFNSEEGVLYAEIAALADDLSYRGMSISDGSKSNRVSIYYSNISNEILGLVISGFSISLNIAHPLYEVKDYHKIAIKYKENDFALWANGVEVGTANTGATPIGLSELAFDGGDGADDFYGKARSVKYFPEALGDTKLMTLTGGDGSLKGLLNAFRTRVIADGGTIEAETCIKNEIKELL